MNKRQWLLLGIAAGMSSAVMCRLVLRRHRHNPFVTISRHETGNISVSLRVIEEMIGRWIEETYKMRPLHVDASETEEQLNIDIQLPFTIHYKLQDVRWAVHQTLTKWFGVELPLSAIQLTTNELRKD